MPETAKRVTLDDNDGARSDVDSFFNHTGVATAGNLNHTPFVVIGDGKVTIETSPSRLAEDYDDEDVVVCSWPGRWRSDFMKFTVSQFKEQRLKRLGDA